MQIIESKAPADIEVSYTPARTRPSPSAIRVEESTPNLTNMLQPEDDLCVTPTVRTIESSAQSHDNFDLQEEPPVDVSPSVGTRPLGRKSSKERLCAKRQASNEDQSAIGERVAKSLDDLQAASSVGWQRANALNEEEQPYSIKHKKLQIIKERLSVEREMILAEKDLYDFDPTAIETPIDKLTLSPKGREDWLHYKHKQMKILHPMTKTLPERMKINLKGRYRNEGLKTSVVFNSFVGHLIADKAQKIFLDDCTSWIVVV